MQTRLTLHLSPDVIVGVFFINEKFSYYYEDFAKCINVIFDQSSGDKEIRHMCLDIWDGFFENIAKDTMSIRTTQKLFNSF